nr:uncharacterized protein LOC127308918 [Lolium perenne]
MKRADLTVHLPALRSSVGGSTPCLASGGIADEGAAAGRALGGHSCRRSWTSSCQKQKSARRRAAARRVVAARGLGHGRDEGGVELDGAPVVPVDRFRFDMDLSLDLGRGHGINAVLTMDVVRMRQEDHTARVADLLPLPWPREAAFLSAPLCIRSMSKISGELFLCCASPSRIIFSPFELSLYTYLQICGVPWFEPRLFFFLGTEVTMLHWQTGWGFDHCSKCKKAEFISLVWRYLCGRQSIWSVVRSIPHR